MGRHGRHPQAHGQEPRAGRSPGGAHSRSRRWKWAAVAVAVIAVVASVTGFFAVRGISSDAGNLTAPRIGASRTASELSPTPGTTGPSGGRSPAASHEPGGPSGSNESGSAAGGCISNPGSCGYPDATTTGIQPGVILTQVPSQATSGPGWRYQNGVVTVTGNVGSPTSGLQLAPGDEVVIPDGVSNVTIDNVKLTGLTGENDNGVTVGTNSCQTDGCGPNNITIENCFIHAVNETAGAVGGGIYVTWQSKSVAVKNCDIYGTAGGIYYAEEDGVEVTTGNYIHGPGASSASQHLNGIGDDAGPPDRSSSWVIGHNTVLMTGVNGDQVTAAISLFPDGGPQVNDNVSIEGNLLDTGNYYLIDNGYGDAFGSAGQSYISITDNRLGDSGHNKSDYQFTWYIAPNLPGCGHFVANACTGDTERGNVWDATGKSAD